MPKPVVDISELKGLVKQFDDNEKKREDIEHNRKIADAMNEADRLIEEIPWKLRQAAGKGEQRILVFKHYGSNYYSDLVEMSIINFCDSMGLGYSHYSGKDIESGHICEFLYVNF